MELWIVRHAQAVERGVAGSDDRQRPLTAVGRRQAAALATLALRLGVRFDRVFTSPLLRAVQTAEALRPALRAEREVETLAELVAGAAGAFSAALRGRLDPADARAACVGHEPRVRELAGLLVTGDATRLGLRVRKGSVLVLEGEPRPAGMVLAAFLPPTVVAAALADE